MDSPDATVTLLAWGIDPTTCSIAVDIWSVGCIFAKLILKQPLFQAKDEIETISMIFKLLGPPSRDSWPDCYTLPASQDDISAPSQSPQLCQKFPFISDSGIDLMMRFLTYDPEWRTTTEEVLRNLYFKYVFLLFVQRA